MLYRAIDRGNVSSRSLCRLANWRSTNSPEAPESINALQPSGARASRDSRMTGASKECFERRNARRVSMGSSADGGTTLTGFGRREGAGRVLTTEVSSLHSSHSSTENLFFQQGVLLTAGEAENPTWEELEEGQGQP